ncbi:hypothetical protein J6590_026801 [Homalodisca vitripennis]|nr:hypothetical protein J6590_026801 [Homalodisca vitripennis]
MIPVRHRSEEQTRTTSTGTTPSTASTPCKSSQPRPKLRKEALKQKRLIKRPVASNNASVDVKRVKQTSITSNPPVHCTKPDAVSKSTELSKRSHKMPIMSHRVQKSPVDVGNKSGNQAVEQVRDNTSSLLKVNLSVGAVKPIKTVNTKEREILLSTSKQQRKRIVFSEDNDPPTKYSVVSSKKTPITEVQTPKFKQGRPVNGSDNSKKAETINHQFLIPKLIQRKSATESTIQSSSYESREIEDDVTSVLSLDVNPTLLRELDRKSAIFAQMAACANKHVGSFRTNRNVRNCALLGLLGSKTVAKWCCTTRIAHRLNGEVPTYCLIERRGRGGTGGERRYESAYVQYYR